MSEPSLNLSTEDQTLAEKLATLKLNAEPMDRDALMYACGFAAGQASREHQVTPANATAHASRSGRRPAGTWGLALGATVAAFLLGGLCGQHLVKQDSPHVSTIATQSPSQTQRSIDQTESITTAQQTGPSLANGWLEGTTGTGGGLSSEGVLYAGLQTALLSQFLAGVPAVEPFVDDAASGTQQRSMSNSAPSGHGDVLKITDSRLAL